MHTRFGKVAIRVCGLSKSGSQIRLQPIAPNHGYPHIAERRGAAPILGKRAHLKVFAISTTLQRPSFPSRIALQYADKSVRHRRPGLPAQGCPRPPGIIAS